MSYKLIPYETILTAKRGEAEAMIAIIKHYRNYIAHFSRRTFYDEYGNSYEVVDEEIMQRIEAKLMVSIFYKFDPERLPEGETLTH